MDIKSSLIQILNQNQVPIHKITFFKTKIISYLPYKTEIILKKEINIDNIKDVYNEILNAEINVEYALCLDDNIPSYDNKNNGYRLTYNMNNTLDDFNNNKVFFLMAKKCKIDINTDKNNNKTLSPTIVVFMLNLFIFLIFDNPIIQKTYLKYIESVIIIKKERKTNITFHVKDCDDIEEFEKNIKRTFVLNPVSIFSRKKFNI